MNATDPEGLQSLKSAKPYPRLKERSFDQAKVNAIGAELAKLAKQQAKDGKEHSVAGYYRDGKFVITSRETPRKIGQPANKTVIDTTGARDVLYSHYSKKYRGDNSGFAGNRGPITVINSDYFRSKRNGVDSWTVNGSGNIFHYDHRSGTLDVLYSSEHWTKIRRVGVPDPSKGYLDD